MGEPSRLPKDEVAGLMNAGVLARRACAYSRFEAVAHHDALADERKLALLARSVG